MTTTKTRNFIAALVVAALAAIALISPAGASAAVCYKEFPAPTGGTYKVQQNGSLDTQVITGDGSAFDENHGTLRVAGVAYPAVGDATCSSNATSITFPAKNLNGVTVTRSISLSGGNLRFLDTIYNPAAVGKSVDIDWDIKIQAGQRIVRGSAGGSNVDDDDDWVLLEDDSAFPFIQWGQQSGFHPDVISDDPQQTQWHTEGLNTPDARLHYASRFFGPKQTSRVLHSISIASSSADGVAKANNTVPVFSGYSKATAVSVFNWGNDPDKDGVTTANDDCPGVTGNGPNGCLQGVINPPPPPPPADPPADPAVPPADPAGGGSTPTPAPAPPVIRDSIKPKILIGSLVKSIKRSRLAGTGLKPKIRCSESCKVTVALQVRKLRSKRASTLITVKRSGLSALTRALTFKVRANKLTRLARQRVTLVITATDAAGNRSSVTKQVTLLR